MSVWNFFGVFASSKKKVEEIKVIEPVEVVRQPPVVSAPDDMMTKYNLWDIIEEIEEELGTKPMNKKEYNLTLYKLLTNDTIANVKAEYISKGWKSFECIENQLVEGISIVTLKR